MSEDLVLKTCPFCNSGTPEFSDMYERDERRYYCMDLSHCASMHAETTSYRSKSWYWTLEEMEENLRKELADRWNDRS